MEVKFMLAPWSVDSNNYHTYVDLDFWLVFLGFFACPIIEGQMRY